MKRSKLITFAMFVSFTLLGVGYAAWNQTLTINNRVTTAEFNVAFMNGVDNQTTKDPNNQYYSVSVSNNDNSDRMTFNITDLYPGASAGLYQTIKNNGTIPIKFSNSTFDSGSIVDSKGLNSAGKLTYMGSIELFRKNQPSSHTMLFQYPANNANAFAEELSHCLTQWNSTGTNLVLNPEDHIVIYYNVSWGRRPNNANIDDNNYKNATLTYDIKFNYSQL